MREPWKRETCFRYKSFSSELAVKYFHVGRRKIQIFPPLGEQDQSNALPLGQQRQSNPHPHALPPPPPPAGFTLIGSLEDGFALQQVSVRIFGTAIGTMRHSGCYTELLCCDFSDHSFHT